MRKTLLFLILFLSLATRSAGADPGVSVVYRDGLMRVTLVGSYSGAYYLVWRSGEWIGPFAPMSSDFSLCTGDCFLTDLEAIPGQTYFYRFDLQTPQGDLVSYGPYAVTVPDTPLGARLRPNPTSGPAVLELSVPGSSRRDPPVAATARLLDVQGRNVRTLFSGMLAPGITTLRWDGADASGRPVHAGVYFLRLATPRGTVTSRLVRIR